VNTPPSPNAEPATIAPRLGLWDAVSIIVGIVVGTAIFKSPMMVFQSVAGPWQAMGVWLTGGVLSLCGAFCYAELATTYPRDGGDYEYLNRAYGRWLGFLFGWAQLAVILSASIGVMAYAFADYGTAIWPNAARHSAWLAVAAIVALSVLNALGIVAGKVAQNVLSAVKVLGLAALVLAGLWVGSSASTAPPTTQGSFVPSLGLAMVFVLYAYGGWNDAAFVAAEVRDQRRNLPRALWIGIFGITAIYLAVNAVYVGVLGFDAARQSPAPAADVLEHAVGHWGRAAISLLVMLSALGAINGMILAGSRVYAVLGADYPAVAWLGAWNRQSAVPLPAIGLQALAAVLMVLAVGTSAGQSLVDASLGGVGLSGLPWHEFPGGFEMLVAGSAPVFWTFFLLTGIAVFLLRWKDPAANRPFSIPLFPLPPLVFCATCLFMLYRGLAYARWLVLLGVVPLAVGAVLLLVVRRNAAGSDATD
jgi:APA family basic amino acid/polyamine antiporter